MFGSWDTKDVIDQRSDQPIGHMAEPCWQYEMEMEQQQLKVFLSLNNKASAA